MTGGTLPAMTWQRGHGLRPPEHRAETDPAISARRGRRSLRAAATGAQGGVVQLGQPTSGALSRRSFEVLGGIGALLKGAERPVAPLSTAAGLGPRRRRPAVRDRRHGARSAGASPCPSRSRAAPVYVDRLPSASGMRRASRGRLSERRPGAGAAASAVLVVYAFSVAPGSACRAPMDHRGRLSLRRGALRRLDGMAARRLERRRSLYARREPAPATFRSGSAKGSCCAPRRTTPAGPLDARCAYRVGTTAPQARYWTLALYDEAGRPSRPARSQRASRRPRSSAMRMAASRSCCRGTPGGNWLRCRKPAP